MNVGLPDLPKKSYLRKIVLFREFKSLRSHKTKLTGIFLTDRIEKFSFRFRFVLLFGQRLLHREIILKEGSRRF